MHMSTKGFVKGMAIGIVTGATVGMVVSPKTKHAKKNAGNFLRAAGEVIENISGMWA